MMKLYDTEKLECSTPTSSMASPVQANDSIIKKYHNRTTTKVKLLVRSHAIRESTSPPRDPLNDQYDRSTSAKSSMSLAIGSPDLSFRMQSAKTFEDEKCLLLTTSLQQHQLKKNSSQWSKQNTNEMSLSTKEKYVNQENTSYQEEKNGIIISKSQRNDNFRINQQMNSSILSSECSNCLKNIQQHEKVDMMQTPLSPSRIDVSINQKKGQLNRSEFSKTQYSINCIDLLTRNTARQKLEHQNSPSQDSYEGTSRSFRKDNSIELYTDSTGTDLEKFIIETMNRNQKDRTVLLKIEKDLIEFARDKKIISYKFPNMSSYNRMLVHRIAAYFGMEHNVDQSGLSVIVTRTDNMRIPEIRFKEHIRHDSLQSEEPRRSILKRDSNSLEEILNSKSPDRFSGEYYRRSKSFEEREEEYEKARRRIFKDSSGDSSDIASWPYWSSSESSDTSATAVRYRLLHPSEYTFRKSRLSKEECFDGKNSFRSNSFRPSFSKSFSFGGYTRRNLPRDDSVTSTHSAGARLMKQANGKTPDSGTSICSLPSPSSSGYKSQSQRSERTISPSPTPSPIPNESCQDVQSPRQDVPSPELTNQTVMWAVTSFSSVPPGSVIINPQTHQPHTNPDGTLYYFDPDDPPQFSMERIDRKEVYQVKKPETPALMEDSSTLSQNDDYKNQRSIMKKHSSGYNTGVMAKVLVTSIPNALVNRSYVTSTPLSLSSASPPLPLCLRTPSVLQAFSNQQKIEQRPHLLAISNQQQMLPQLLVTSQQPQQQQQQQRVLVRSRNLQACAHKYMTEPYTNSISTAKFHSQFMYQPPVVQQTIGMSSNPFHTLLDIHNTRREGAFIQNPFYTNYARCAQQPQPFTQLGEVAESSSYFMDMNMYNYGTAVVPPVTPPPYSQLVSSPPSSALQTVSDVQPLQTNYWQSSVHGFPIQPPIYFMPSSDTGLFLDQNQNGKQQLPQQQSLTASYSFNSHPMTSQTQTTSKLFHRW